MSDGIRSSNTVLCVHQSVNPGAVRFTKSCPCSRWFSDNDTRRSESGYGRGFSKTPLTRLNIAVFAPMPSASVCTATAVKPGFFSNWRKANLRSFITQCLHWIDIRRPARGDVAREEGNNTQESGNARKSKGVK